MSPPRIAWSIVCDDVRTETGNKHSLMGIYETEILVPSFPSTLSKLCFVIYARTPADRPFKDLIFKVIRDDEAVLAEAPINVSSILSAPIPDAPGDELHYTGKVVCAFSPMHFVEECKLSARVNTESEELRAGSVFVKQTPPKA